MSLGDAWQVTRSVKNLKETLPFYLTLGFQIVGQDVVPYPWAQLTDGFILITLGQDTGEASGLAFFASDMEQRAERLKKDDIKVEKTKMKIGDWYQTVVYDPDNFPIHLIGYDAAKLPKLPGKPISKCGQFAEISIEVSDLQKSLAFWNQLGFSPEAGGTSKWCSTNNGVFQLGLYEKGSAPHGFHNPCITYFEPDMAQRLAGLSKEGIKYIFEFPPNKEGLLESAIAEAPDGQYFFLFKF
ncbi:MAG: VOC family protein [Ignavibacteriales bacterium]|nr:VOC family protein [Ignavibacteriales bacterium]